MCPGNRGELFRNKKCKVARSEALTNPGYTAPSSGYLQGSPTPLLSIRFPNPAIDPVHVGDFKSVVPFSLFCRVPAYLTAPSVGGTEHRAELYRTVSDTNHTRRLSSPARLLSLIQPDPCGAPQAVKVSDSRLGTLSPPG
ncbi:hypothetical protein E3U43_010597 [Larimichthys crocea]|uniref:Uncharacterized protein n=1 Tax=Larimichthys crocea TaxID=215358 RepID=A0ACD3RH36_LARCR|nr:hypothetical protein E3U43_010597 [Larimichthys crocea]